MERVANKAPSFAEAERWDREQMWAMTPEERLEVARILRERAYGPDAPDVRQAGKRPVGPSGNDLGRCQHGRHDEDQ